MHEKKHNFLRSLIKIVLIAVITIAAIFTFNILFKNSTKKDNFDNAMDSFDEEIDNLYPNGYPSVEEYYNLHRIDFDNIQKQFKKEGATVSIENNTVVITYELKNKEGFSEEYIKSDRFIEDIEEMIEQEQETLQKQAKTLCDNTGLEDARYVYRYCYDGEIIVEKTINPERR